MNAIACKKLTLGYEKKTILKNLNFEIAHGEFIGIFGRNGVGKSTFFRAVLGLVQPLSGTILVCGRPPHQGNRCIGYMPQVRHDGESFPLTGRIYLQAAIVGCGWGIPVLNKIQKQRIEESIRLVQMEDYIDRPCLQYSGGERQRLALAQALLDQPEILLLDEPLSNLDIANSDKMIQLIHKLQSELKITVLFTAHNINALLPVMTRVMYFGHQKAAIGTIEEVVNNEMLSWLYDAPVEVLHIGKDIIISHKH